VTLSTLVLWTVEMVYMKRKTARTSADAKNNEIFELCKFNIQVN